MTTEQNTEHELNWPGMAYPITIGVPPKNALDVGSWADLDPANETRHFLLTSKNGQTRTITLGKGHAQQILSTLKRRPIRSASRARLSEFVSRLIHDHGVEIHCERYDNNAFGVYFLVSQVERIEAEVAA